MGHCWGHDGAKGTFISAAGITQWWATSQAYGQSLEKEFREFHLLPPWTAFMFIDSLGAPESLMDTRTVGENRVLANPGCHPKTKLR